MHRNAALAIASRSLVSFAYGFIVAIFPLYLRAIGYGSVEIGLMVFAAMIVNALLGVVAGMLADHYGRKYVLIALLAAFSVASGTFTSLRYAWALAAAAGLAGFAAGSTGGPIGSGGPLGAVQTAIISEVADRRSMSVLLSTAAILEMLSAMGGAFTLSILSYLGAYVYALFYVAAALGVVSVALSAFIVDTGIRSRRLLPSLSYGRILRLSIPTVPCGLGSGIVLPLLSLWFEVRYHVGVGEIGVVFGAMDAMMVVFMLIIPRLSLGIGRLKTIVITRVASSLSFIAMAFSPIFAVAGLFLVLRGAFAMGGMPVRQSFVMTNVHESERATANGFTSFSRNTASSIGPTISGYLMGVDAAALPMYGGLIALLDPLLYYLLFRDKWSSD
ncbi:MFS transporter [Conexivisphaera calida]|uniref:Multidrug resistance protein n=1 Tax=Conexivisphaera calida TaxID=1874277 RepID=A0A4P2VM51_9ARCH|nr:MFS transporter [Conexivisphaera calida]BBE42138.1 Multidrug resistance protein [Conexivisphaera calida]